MSAAHSYEYSASENAKRQLEAERYRREMELARLKAERAEAERRQREMERARLRAEAQEIHRQTLAYGETQRQQMSSSIQVQQQKIQESQSTLDALDAQSARLKKDLDKAEQSLAHSEAQVRQAQTDLQTQIKAIQDLQHCVGEENVKLQNSIRQAEATLSQVQHTATEGLKDTETLSQANVQGQQMAEKIGELDQQIQTLQQEMAFVNLQSELQPVAMALLMGMQENRYELQQTLTQGELIAYFKKADSEHQIAVRMTPAIRRGEDIKTWDLIAETFEMDGETCLEELDDFDTAMEEIDIGELQHIKHHPFPIYPKDESSRIREKRGVLPAPKKVGYSARSNRKRDMKKEKNR